MLEHRCAAGALTSVELGPTELIWGELRGSVTVLCPPGDIQGGEKRFWCKLGRTGCTLIADTDGYVGNSYQGRILITPQESSGAFKILINDLKKEDSGLYRCGTGRPNGEDSPRPTCFLLAVSSPVFGPRQVYGLLNGSVTVKCFYPPTSVNRHDRKYWCRESAMGCMTIVSTSGYTAPGYKGRVSITDYPQAENFQINISELTMADAGTYQCGVGVNSKGLCPHVPEGAELFYVKLHSTLTMSCSFGPDYASVRKFLCKMEKDGCRNVIDSYGNIATDYTGRVLMSSEGTPGSFSVVITQMGWKDSGLYLCGVAFFFFFLIWYLFSGESGTWPIITGVKGTSATFECRYNPLQRSSGRYWCKWRQNGCSRIIDTSGYVSYAYEGRVAIFDSPENTTMTIILNQLSDKDNGYYWCMTDEQKEQQSSTELKIIDGQPGLTGKKEVEAQAGSRVDLACYYPCKYYSYQKYWCKWNNTGCSVLPASDQRQPGPGVTCDRDNKTVILSFDPVEKTNEGWYWCGVKRNGVYGETMAVHLSVTGGEPQGSGGVRGAWAETETNRCEEFRTAEVVRALTRLHRPRASVWVFISFLFPDVVSIGSYRTNISMSDFESVKGSSQPTYPCPFPFPSSKEDADLAYSTFLLTSSSIAQAGTEGVSAAPDASSPSWGGQI
uniref:Polymeric immunoglobulin receptor n=1 Tax=Athene cunicularia TaxID=194338 RepID=A0A663MD73_ATHCN